MLKALFYQAVYRMAEKEHQRAERIRAWAWDRIVAGWPPDEASRMLRDLSTGER